MDINLTGQIAANLADNLRQPNPILNIGAGAIGGLVTGIITLYAVKITNTNAEKREELKRKDETKRMKREETKKIYSQMLSVLYEAQLRNLNKSVEYDQLSKEKYYNMLSQCIAEINLLNPEMAQKINQLAGEFLFKTFAQSPDNIPKFYAEMINEFNTEILPLMQKELNLDASSKE
jgi:hypothetical protein